MTDKALEATGDQLKTLQSNQLLDARFDESRESNSGDTSNSNLTDGAGVELDASGEFIEFDTSFPYAIDAAEIGLKIRGEITGSTVDLLREINGQGLELGQATTSGAVWFGSDNFGDNNTNLSLDANETATVRLEHRGGGRLDLDLVALYDNQYSYNFDDTLDGNDELSGPELFPDVETVKKNISTRRDVTEATISTDFANGDTSSSQFVEVSIGSKSNQNNDAESATLTVSDANASTDLEFRIGVGRRTQDSSETPTSGDQAQAVNSYSFTANPDAITAEGIGEIDIKAIIPEDTANGETFAEAGAIETANGNLYTHSLIPQFDKSSDQSVISAERIKWRNK